MPYVGVHYEISLCAFNNEVVQTNKFWNILIELYLLRGSDWLYWRL